MSLNLTSAAKASVTPAEGGKTAWFSANFPATSGSCMFVAISPAKALAGVDASNYSVQYTIPSEQTPEAHSADQSAHIIYGMTAPTTGLPDEVTMPFNHLNSYMKVALTNLKSGVTVKSVTLSTEDVNLTGVVTYNAISTKSTVNGNKYVTARTSNPDEVWFGVAPCDLSSKSLTVKVKTDQGVFTKTITLPASANLTPGLSLIHI